MGPEWRKAAGGTFGEFMLQNNLLAGLPTQRGLVQAAAAGWGGDAWNLYVNGDGRLLQATIAWDTPEDAKEYWSALLDSLRAQGDDVSCSSDVALHVASGSTTWRGALEGSTMTLVVSNNSEAANAIALQSARLCFP
jgi:hypothetical protein